MMVAASTPESRANWIADLDRLAALNPKIAVAGHKKAGALDTPDAIEASKGYLTDYGRLKESTSSEHELYDAMTELYPGWASNRPGLTLPRAGTARRSCPPHSRWPGPCAVPGGS
jgi:hypothetical protein